MRFAGSFGQTPRVSHYPCSGFWGQVTWNNFVWGFTSLKAYHPTANWFPPDHTVVLRIEGSMSGTTTWAETKKRESPMVVDYNPDIFANPALYDAVSLHEMGHARGYGHVSGCLNQTIMDDDFPWYGPYSTDFGPSDTTAAQRDIQ